MDAIEITVTAQRCRVLTRRRLEGDTLIEDITLYTRRKS